MILAEFPFGLELCKNLNIAIRKLVVRTGKSRSPRFYFIIVYVVHTSFDRPANF